ncbi:MAG: hypothetical protein Sw2PiMacB_35790 [Shewanella algae]
MNRKVLHFAHKILWLFGFATILAKQFIDSPIKCVGTHMLQVATAPIREYISRTTRT